MTKYQFTGEYPMIFADLSFSDGSLRPAVVASHAEGTDWPDHDPDGSTVTLYPGDTLEIDHDYPEHAYLVPLDESAPPKATMPSVKDLQAELTARGIEFPRGAKKADLEALLVPHLDVLTDNGVAPSTSGDATEIDLTLSGDAADTSSTSSTSPEE